MSLHRKHVLITAGPTREWMDPVRFLSNPSSGSMGLEIARALQKQGAQVTVVLGPTSLDVPKHVSVIRVESALQMFAAVKSQLRKADAFIASAAVGDWRFAQMSSTKLKKDNSSVMTVRLKKNPDILAWVGSQQKNRRDLLVVGFALETNRLFANAATKLKRKNLDLIIANDPSSFASAKIHAQWMEKNRTFKNLGRLTKQQLAQRLARWLGTTWKTTSNH